MERPDTIVVVNFATQPGFRRWGHLLRDTFLPRDNSDFNELLEAIDKAGPKCPERK
jgi:hypothetical protein